jgi:hypothetical protein
MANIEHSINQKLQREMEEIHKKQQQQVHNLAKSQTTNTTSKSTNYPRVINITKTQFTQEEIQLLSKGLKYNLHYKQKNWVETLSLEAETAISNLEIKEQQYYRHAVVKVITRITQENENKNNTNKENKKEWTLMTDIKKQSANK